MKIARLPHLSVSAPVLGGIATIAAFCLLLIVFHAVGMEFDLSWPGTPLRAFGEAALLTLPYWWLPPRWRLTAPAVLWVVAIYLYANLLYSRAFNDFMALDVLGYTANINSTLLHSTLALVRPSDLFIALVPALLTILFILVRRRIAAPRPIALRSRLMATAISLALVTVSQFSYSSRLRRFTYYTGESLSWSEAFTSRITTDFHNRAQEYRSNGLAVSFVKNLIFSFREGRADSELSPQALAQFLDRAAARHLPPDSIFAANRGKNLILLVVESLNAPMLDSVYCGIELTPNLNALAHAPGSITARHIISQVSKGVSADGQFIYNTGLLPLRSYPVTMKYPDGPYPPSLRSHLDAASSAMIVVESSRTWNKHRMAPHYGIDSIFGRETHPDGGRYDYDQDARVMRRAAEIIPTLRRPFYAVVTTLSMHMPFIDKARYSFADGLPLRSMKRDEANYMMTVRYFDACLGQFITTLKQQGLWDNTVLVVVSDHSYSFASGAYGDLPVNSPGSILFVAANTGLTAEIENTVGQVDVYPTILDIMGIPLGSWRGLGISMLNPAASGAVDLAGALHGNPADSIATHLSDAWQASATIIRQAAK